MDLPRLARGRHAGIGGRRSAAGPVSKAAGLLHLAQYRRCGRSRAHLQGAVRRGGGGDASSGNFLGIAFRYADRPVRDAMDSQLREGDVIRQITDGPYINHPTYFLQSSFFPGDAAMFFTSYRTGAAQLFRVELDTGETTQLTHGEPIHPYSAALNPDGATIVVTRGSGLWAKERAGERRIVDFPGAQLGECSITRHGVWL